MITTDQIKEIINSLEHYNGSKWNLKAIYNYLRDEYYSVTYDPYCKSCSACGIDSCCSAVTCKFDKDCLYGSTYLNDLKIAYLNVEDLFRLLYDYDNKELLDKANAIYDKNYDIIYGPYRNIWINKEMVEMPDMSKSYE